MKKVILVTTLLIMTIMLTAIPASGEEALVGYEYAVKLKSIDLFRGTDIGFELEREPNRLEGAVMFVRLLGKEREALDNEYPHPFSDVPDWASPYVGYLYHNLLTNGISETEFGSYMPIRAISYMTFVLRALGYSDSGSGRDFDWSNALVFASENELIGNELYSELAYNDFLRGHIAWLSYKALALNVKPGDVTLIELLVSEGSVDEVAAADLGLLPGTESGLEKITLGYPEGYVLDLYGIPDHSVVSRYGFNWNIYENGFAEYIQVGVKDGSIEGLLAASPGFEYENGVSIGMGREILTTAYPDGPLAEFRKPDPDGTTVWIYSLDNENKSTYRTAGGNYITYYFDSYENDVITALLVIDYDTETETIESFDNVNNELYESYERQVFGITNAFRIQRGEEPVFWENRARQAAVLHSKDMAEREYFSHYTPEGDSMGDRLTAQGVDWISAGENIAYGYRNPVHMVNDWLNSQTGHREILLGDFTYLGVGVWIDNDNRIYSTQDYWR